MYQQYSTSAYTKEQRFNDKFPLNVLNYQEQGIKENFEYFHLIICRFLFQ